MKKTSANRQRCLQLNVINLKLFSLTLLSVIFYIGCNNQASQKEQASGDSSKVDTSFNNYDQILTEKEKSSSQTNTDNLGKLISKIIFRVKTNNLTDYKEGFIPYITIENPKGEIKNLINKNEIVISQCKITIIVDYPLNNVSTFDLISGKGFTRETLVKEISRHYHEIYDEEERTATIKTIPVDKRTKTYNRNQTNGKYGICGHDMADLVLADILVYKTSNGQIILSLEMES